MILSQHESQRLIEFSLDPLFEEYGIVLAVMGILVVFLALTLVVAFITVLPRIVQRISVRTTQGQPVVTTAATDELPEELLVVIAAAVAETMQHPHRIVRVRGPEDLSWSLQARLRHHHSHSIDRRDHR